MTTLSVAAIHGRFLLGASAFLMAAALAWWLMPRRFKNRLPSGLRISAYLARIAKIPGVSRRILAPLRALRPLAMSPGAADCSRDRKFLTGRRLLCLAASFTTLMLVIALGWAALKHRRPDVTAEATIARIDTTEATDGGVQRPCLVEQIAEPATVDDLIAQRQRKGFFLMACGGAVLVLLLAVAAYLTTGRRSCAAFPK